MFDYKTSELAPGKLIEVTLEMLPGKPKIWLEHLGDTNETWVAAQITEANSKNHKLGRRSGKVTKKALAEVERKIRDDLAAHAVRKLEAVHKDGTPATTEDIPRWCDAIPIDIAHRLHDVARNPDVFRDPVDDADAIAGK